MIQQASLGNVISTHSLTRRLTDYRYKTSIVTGISTHSLTRRLTVIRKLGLTIVIFQLTASQGG